MNNQRLFRISLITLSTLIPLFLHSCKEEPNTAPIAAFTISPAFGTTDSTFTFDASGVKDLEDPVADLQVRWDWESDSVFDTDFSINKIVKHKFTAGGTIYITVEVKDTKGKTNRFTDFVKVAWNNRPPKAALHITPPKGFLQDVFVMDASACSDYEDKNADLLVRFDFEGDGTWDTEYSKTKIVNHQYTGAGTFPVKVIVKDNGGATDEEIVNLQVGPVNQAPEAPKNPQPADQASQVSTLSVLTWTCIDPETDSLKYDIYFGKEANPPKVATNQSGAQFICLPLEYTSTYYWKVVARDPYSHEIAGPVWSFTTNSPLNPMGTFTDARDGKVYKTVTINDRIWMAQNLNIGTMINSSTGGDRGDGYQLNNKKTEKFCYKNEAANCEIYGGLYQWDEAMAPTGEGATGICPDDWHLPTDAEWHELVLFLDPVDGEAKAGDQLALGSQSGFQALFSGYIIFAERKYYDIGNAGYFWSSTVNPTPELNHMSLMRSIYRGKSAFQQDTSQKVNGLSVRCVKDY
ncbi:MAG: FISUMP domain-containing protein [Bacteroidales bacterium]